MMTFLRTPATAVWAVLVAATLASWALGTDRVVHGYTVASVAVLIIAFIKVRLVGLYFMELREAPTALRAVFETYCVGVCTIVVLVFLLA